MAANQFVIGRVGDRGCVRVFASGDGGHILAVEPLSADGRAEEGTFTNTDRSAERERCAIAEINFISSDRKAAGYTDNT
jgi:hypothetical protein